MREQGICGLPRQESRRRGEPRGFGGEDLVNRQFSRDGPNRLWMTDITEHPTREGKLYCCAVLDAWSRKVVGWSIDRRPTAAMVNSALAMAVTSRKPPPGAVIHSDHGPQCTSWAFSHKVRAEGLVQSFGRVGDASDNAVVLSTAIFDWIEAFYNRARRHSSLGHISPVEFERRHQQQPHAA